VLLFTLFVYLASLYHVLTHAQCALLASARVDRGYAPDRKQSPATGTRPSLVFFLRRRCGDGDWLVEISGLALSGTGLVRGGLIWELLVSITVAVYPSWRLNGTTLLNCVINLMTAVENEPVQNSLLVFINVMSCVVN